jgi:hypothetical protein
MALFVLLGVLSPRRRLYEPEAAGFRLRRTDVRLPVPFAGTANPLCGLDQNKNCSFLNWTPFVFILNLRMDTAYSVQIFEMNDLKTIIIRFVICFNTPFDIIIT